MDKSQHSEKYRLAALILCAWLGWLGAHRFYVGKTGTAILMILTFGGFGIWIIVDLVMILVGSFTDKDGKILFRWVEPGSI